jgi:hypothetical protein
LDGSRMYVTLTKMHLAFTVDARNIVVDTGKNNLADHWQRSIEDPITVTQPTKRASTPALSATQRHGATDSRQVPSPISSKDLRNSISSSQPLQTLGQSARSMASPRLLVL